MTHDSLLNTGVQVSGAPVVFPPRWANHQMHAGTFAKLFAYVTQVESNPRHQRVGSSGWEAVSRKQWVGSSGWEAEGGKQ